MKNHAGGLTGSPGRGFIDKNSLSQLANKAHTVKKKSNRKGELIDVIKKKHSEIMMKDKL